MVLYRCYFMRDDHIIAPDSIEATDDAAAMLAAERLLISTSFREIEIWEGARSVGRFIRPSSAEAALVTKLLAANAWVEPDA